MTFHAVETRGAEIQAPARRQMRSCNESNYGTGLRGARQPSAGHRALKEILFPLAPLVPIPREPRTDLSTVP